MTHEHEYPHRPCVGCGACCKVAACAFGETSETGECRFLVPWEGDTLNVQRYRCGIHDKILADPTHDLCPAFGAGCCMSMCNEERQQVLTELYRRGLP